MSGAETSMRDRRQFINAYCYYTYGDGAAGNTGPIPPQTLRSGNLPP
jgi:hypothetical protein